MDLIKIITALVISQTLLTHTSAATYYVNNQAAVASGSNTGTSEAAPFLTINKAAGMASPGDTVYILPGVYRESLTPVRDGTSSQQIQYFGIGNVEILGSENISAGYIGPYNFAGTGYLKSDPYTTLNFDTDDFMFEVFLSPLEEDYYETIINKGNLNAGAGPYYYLGFLWKQLRFMLRDNADNSVWIYTGLLYNRPNYLVFLKTSSHIYLYVNGSLKASAPHSLSGAITINNHYFTIGRLCYTDQGYFKGKIFEIRAWRWAPGLSPTDISTQIQERYQRWKQSGRTSFTQDRKGLISRWTFDRIRKEKIVDLEGSHPLIPIGNHYPAPLFTWTRHQGDTYKTQVDFAIREVFECDWGMVNCIALAEGNDKDKLAKGAWKTVSGPQDYVYLNPSVGTIPDNNKWYEASIRESGIRAQSHTRYDNLRIKFFGHSGVLINGVSQVKLAKIITTLNNIGFNLTGRASSNQIINSVAYHNLTYGVAATDGAKTLELKNSILADNSLHELLLDGASAPGNDSNNNLYGPGTIRYNEKVYSSLAEFRAATGLDPNSFKGDPLLLDPDSNYFRPANNSPVVGRGLDYGARYTGRPDIGAVESRRVDRIDLHMGKNDWESVRIDLDTALKNSGAFTASYFPNTLPSSLVSLRKQDLSDPEYRLYALTDPLNTSTDDLWLIVSTRGLSQGDYTGTLILDFQGEKENIELGIKVYNLDLGQPDYTFDAEHSIFHLPGGEWRQSEKDMAILSRYIDDLIEHRVNCVRVLGTGVWGIEDKISILPEKETLKNIMANNPSRLTTDPLPVLDFSYFDPWFDLVRERGITRLSSYFDNSRFLASLIQQLYGDPALDIHDPRHRRLIKWYWSQFYTYLKNKGFTDLYLKYLDEMPASRIPEFIEHARLIHETGWKSLHTITGDIPQNPDSIKALEPYLDWWQLSHQTISAWKDTLGKNSLNIGTTDLVMPYHGHTYPNRQTYEHARGVHIGAAYEGLPAFHLHSYVHASYSDDLSKPQGKARIIWSDNNGLILTTPAWEGHRDGVGDAGIYRKFQQSFPAEVSGIIKADSPLSILSYDTWGSYQGYDYYLMDENRAGDFRWAKRYMLDKLESLTNQNITQPLPPKNLRIRERSQ